MSEVMKNSRYEDGSGSGSGFVVEDSERVVPTGPDPLHHKTKPERP